MSLFESTLLCFCKPQSKLNLPTLHQGSRERKNAMEQIQNMTLARICKNVTMLIQIATYRYEKITIPKIESTVDIHIKIYICVCVCLLCVYVLCVCMHKSTGLMI